MGPLLRAEWIVRRVPLGFGRDLEKTFHEPWQFDARHKAWNINHQSLAICKKVTNSFSFTSEVCLMNEGGGGGLSSQISAILSYRMTKHFYFPTKLRRLSCFSSSSITGEKCVWRCRLEYQRTAFGIYVSCFLEYKCYHASGVLCNLFGFPVTPNCVTFNYFPREGIRLISGKSSVMAL